MEEGVYKFCLSPENKTDLAAVLSAIFHKNVELDFTKNRYIFEEVLDDDYTFAIRNTPISEYLDIFINDNKTYEVHYGYAVVNYQNFSVVSDKLNN